MPTPVSELSAAFRGGGQVVIFTSFEDFRKRAGDLWVDDVEKILTELIHNIIEAIAGWALEITSALPRVRSGMKKGTWEVHDSFFVHVNERDETDISSASAARAGVARAEAGDRAGLANAAFQSGFVNFGRARGPSGKLIGSPAAPSGITKPVLERLEAEMGRLQADAIERAISKMRAA